MTDTRNKVMFLHFYKFDII